MSTTAMAINRRQFLLTSGALGATALGLYNFGPQLNPESLNPFSEKVMGAGQGLHQGKKIYFLAALNLKYNQERDLKIDELRKSNGALAGLSHYPLSFLAHGLSFHPTRTNIVSIFEKKGPNACELDFRTGITRTITTDAKRFFYGHGAYIYDQGLKLLATETVLASGQGVIVVRDAQTLKIEGQFPSYGANPHDCTLIDGGAVLAVTNGGAPLGQNPKPSVTYIDIKSEKLLDKFEIDDPKFNAGHLAISNQMDLAVVSAPRLGMSDMENGSISLLAKDSSSKSKKLITLKEPKAIIDQLKSETLSLCIDDERGVLAATSPVGNIVTFWNIKTGDFISALNMDRPRGIILSKNKKYFLISYADNASLALVDTQTLKFNPALVAAGAGFSGSHLYSI